MRTSGFAVGVAAAGLVFAGMPIAQAEFGFAVNGTFSVVSNGEWAKTNEVFMDEQTVVQTWTLSSSCTTAHDCTGQVSSDQGWTAPMYYKINAWYVHRDLPNWQPCPDGSTSPGRQMFTFQGIDPRTGMNVKGIDLLGGYDRTMGVGGACGRNMPTVVWMPLTLQRI
jgi:hypothetical protein